MASAINVGYMASQMQKGALATVDSELKVKTADNGEFTVKRFRTWEQWLEYRESHASDSILAVVGENTTTLLLGFNGAIESKINASDINNGEMMSFVRGFFTVTDKGGMAISTKDGLVKPYGTSVEEDMNISDIFLQAGFALKTELHITSERDFF